MCAETEHCGTFALPLLPCKARSFTCSAYMFAALVIQHPKRMFPLVLSSVTCMVLPHFSVLFKKGTVFGYWLLKIKRFILIFSTTSV